jgi:hypothetical protein
VGARIILPLAERDAEECGDTLLVGAVTTEAIDHALSPGTRERMIPCLAAASGSQSHAAVGRAKRTPVAGALALL